MLANTVKAGYALIVLGLCKFVKDKFIKTAWLFGLGVLFAAVLIYK